MSKPITEEEIKQAKEVFDDVLQQAEMEKERQYLTYDELQRALYKLTNEEFSHENVFFKLISEIGSQEPGKIYFIDFLQYYTKIKANFKKSDEVDADTMDAFMALGGTEDEESAIDSQLLIDTIKNQFKLTIDIEALILEVDDSGDGEIQYDEFEELLQSKERNEELKKFSKWFQF